LFAVNHQEKITYKGKNDSIEINIKTPLIQRNFLYFKHLLKHSLYLSYGIQIVMSLFGIRCIELEVKPSLSLSQLKYKLKYILQKIDAFMRLNVA